MSGVIWHDLESGAYEVDLPFWRELADSPVLDVGCGTGRVALDLAEAGYEVTALDVDAELVDALRGRASERGLSLDAVVADAQDFDLGRQFAAVLVPQSSIQLLADRSAALACFARHLRAGGVLAVAVTEECEPYEHPLAESDFAQVDGTRYESQPVALRETGDEMHIERLHWVVPEGGERTVEASVTVLRKLTVQRLADEAAAHGLALERSFSLPDTEEYVGATVAVFRS